MQGNVVEIKEWKDQLVEKWSEISLTDWLTDWEFEFWFLNFEFWILISHCERKKEKQKARKKEREREMTRAKSCDGSARELLRAHESGYERQLPASSDRSTVRHHAETSRKSATHKTHKTHKTGDDSRYDALSHFLLCWDKNFSECERALQQQRNARPPNHHCLSYQIKSKK